MNAAVPRSVRCASCRSAGRVLVCVAGVLLWSVAQGVGLAASPPEIAVSSRPLHSLVAGIVRDVSEPRLLIDGGGAPWDYEPDEHDRRSVTGADILGWSGHELEPGLAPLVAGIGPKTRVFEALASDALKVLPARHDDSLRDPFYWLDSRNMLILLDELAQLIIKHDPDRTQAYERNRRAMVSAIGEIDRILEFGYRDVSGVPVFFYHDTHQYFQQAYAMHVAGSLVAFGRDADVDTGSLLRMRGQMVQADRTCLFTEKGLHETHLDVLLGDGRVRSVELDSFGVSLPPGAALYVELMRSNYQAIADCIGVSRVKTAGPGSDLSVPDVRNFPDRVIPRYLMRDQYGRAVSSTDFRGRLQLINFGYTYCPDVCPTSLAIMGQTMKVLGDDAEQLQPIFITVDPARDTPEVLKAYVAYFDPRMLGLSASPEATKRTAELFRARYEKVPAEDGDPRRYTMDHTASLYLLGRDGEFITKFAHGLPAREVAAQIRRYLGD